MTELKDLMRAVDPASSVPPSSSARRQVVADRAMRGARSRRRAPLRWLVPAAVAAMVVAGVGVAGQHEVLPRLWPSHSANAQMWEMKETLDVSLVYDGEVQPVVTTQIRRWWSDATSDSYLENRSYSEKRGQDQTQYTKWGPPPADITSTKLVTPQFARDRLPRDPSAAVRELRDRLERERPQDAPPAVEARRWLNVASALDRALTSGPLWQGDDLQRWWDLFLAIPGVERDGVADDRRGGQGERWILRSGETWMRVIKAHDSTQVAIIQSRTNELTPTAWEERSRIFGRPKPVDGVPEVVRTNAEQQQWQ